MTAQPAQPAPAQPAPAQPAQPVASGRPWPIEHPSPDAWQVRVVRGEPAPEEMAALVAVLLARRTSAPPAPSPYEAWRAGRLAALRPGGRPAG